MKNYSLLCLEFPCLIIIPCLKINKEKSISVRYTCDEAEGLQSKMRGRHAYYLFRSSSAYLSLHGWELDLYAEVITFGMCFNFRVEMRLVRLLLSLLTSTSWSQLHLLWRPLKTKSKISNDWDTTGQRPRNNWVTTDDMFTVADDAVDLSEFRGNCQTREPCVEFELSVFRWTKGIKALPWFHIYTFGF